MHSKLIRRIRTANKETESLMSGPYIWINFIEGDRELRGTSKAGGGSEANADEIHAN